MYADLSPWMRTLLRAEPLLASTILEAARPDLYAALVVARAGRTPRLKAEAVCELLCVAAHLGDTDVIERFRSDGRLQVGRLLRKLDAANAPTVLGIIEHKFPPNRTTVLRKHFEHTSSSESLTTQVAALRSVSVADLPDEAAGVAKSFSYISNHAWQYDSELVEFLDVLNARTPHLVAPVLHEARVRVWLTRSTVEPVTVFEVSLLASYNAAVFVEQLARQTVHRPLSSTALHWLRSRTTHIGAGSSESMHEAFGAMSVMVAYGLVDAELFNDFVDTITVFDVQHAETHVAALCETAGCLRLTGLVTAAADVALGLYAGRHSFPNLLGNDHVTDNQFTKLCNPRLSATFAVAATRATKRRRVLLLLALREYTSRGQGLDAVCRALSAADYDFELDDENTQSTLVELCGIEGVVSETWLSSTRNSTAVQDFIADELFDACGADLERWRTTVALLPSHAGTLQQLLRAVAALTPATR